MPIATTRSCATCSGLSNVDAGGGWLIFGLPPLPGGGTVAVYQPRHARPEGSR